MAISKVGVVYDVTVAATASDPTSIDAGITDHIDSRNALLIGNLSTATVYFRFEDSDADAPDSSTLTASAGWTSFVGPTDWIELNVSKGVNVYAVNSSAGSAAITVQEAINDGR